MVHPTEKISVLVAHDDPIYLHGLVGLLQHSTICNHIFQVSHDGPLQRLMMTNVVDVAILHYDLLRGNLDALQQLIVRHRQCAFTVICPYQHASLTAIMQSIGVYKIIPPHAGFEIFISVLRERARRGAHFYNAFHRPLEYLPLQLSDLEKKILQQLAEGRAPDDIARALRLPLETVQTCESQLATKLKASTEASLIHQAYQAGVMTLVTSR